MVGGERASVYPLAGSIGVTPAHDGTVHRRDRHIVVLRGANGPVGWLVDRVSRSRLAVRTGLLPLPALVGARARSWFAGVLSTGDRAVLLLSLSSADRAAPSAVEIQHGSAQTSSIYPSAPTLDGPLVVTFSTDALRRFGVARYAVSVRRVAGIESGLEVIVVPGSEPPVIGVSVWRGEVLPVVDVRNAAAQCAADRRRLLILRCGGPLAGTSIAIPVDAETALCQPTHDNPLLDPKRIDADPIPSYVVGMFDVRGQTVALIDPDTLLEGSDLPTATPSSQPDASCAGAGRVSRPWTGVASRVHA
jgi:chemotaxis signal transduction protein